jgi:hypothetical protein
MATSLLANFVFVFTSVVYSEDEGLVVICLPAWREYFMHGHADRLPAADARE